MKIKHSYDSTVIKDILDLDFKKLRAKLSAFSVSKTNVNVTMEYIIR